jgi:Ca2+-binding EF-hand superfamily protein
MPYRPQTPGVILQKNFDNKLELPSPTAKKSILLSNRSTNTNRSRRQRRRPATSQSSSRRSIQSSEKNYLRSARSQKSTRIAASTPQAVIATNTWDASLKNVSSSARHRLAVSHAARIHHKMMLDKICNRLSDQAHRQYPSLRTIYNKLDSDGDGIIDKEEFMAGLKTAGFRLAPVDASLVFDMVDFDGDGLMAYDEFCTIFNPQNVRYSSERLKLHEHVRFKSTDFHISDLRNHLPEVSPLEAEKLRDRLQVKIVYREKDAKITPTLLKAFKTFDPRQDGFISYDEFKEAMGPKPPGLNLGLKDEEITKLISLVDADRDGIITLKEFITSLSKSAILEDFVERIQRMEHDGLKKRVTAPLGKELKECARQYQLLKHKDNIASDKQGQTKPIPQEVANRVLDMLRVRCSASGKIRKVFRTYDEDKSGLISKKELRHVLKNLGVGLNEVETNALFEVFDANGDGGIKYDEFTSAVFAPSRTLENNNTFNLNASDKNERKSIEFANTKLLNKKNMNASKKSFGQFAETRHITVAGSESIFKRTANSISTC